MKGRGSPRWTGTPGIKLLWIRVLRCPSLRVTVSKGGLRLRSRKIDVLFHAISSWEIRKSTKIKGKNASVIWLDVPFSLMMQYSLATILKKVLKSFEPTQVMSLYVGSQSSNRVQNLLTDFRLVTQTILRFSEYRKYQPKKKGLLCLQHCDRCSGRRNAGHHNLYFFLCYTKVF